MDQSIGAIHRAEPLEVSRDHFWRRKRLVVRFCWLAIASKKDVQAATDSHSRIAKSVRVFSHNIIGLTTLLPILFQKPPHTAIEVNKAKLTKSTHAIEKMVRVRVALVNVSLIAT